MRTFIANNKLWIIPYLIMAILSSCSPPNTKTTKIPISSVTPLSATSTQTQTPTVEAMPVTRSTPLALPNGLVVEEYEIKRYMSELEGRYFEPVHGDMEAVFAKRESERSRSNSDQILLPNVTGEDKVEAVVGEERVSVQLEWVNTQEGTAQFSSTVIHITRDGEPIYNMDLGPFAVIYPLQGVWVYDGHWVVEAARVINLRELPRGQIIVSGENLNDKNGYEEAFGFQTMAGKPFYFFMRGGNIGVNFDGQEIDLGYERVQHYQCCSGGAFNPIVSQNMVSFFAQWQGIWYYVEIGIYQ